VRHKACAEGLEPPALRHEGLDQFHGRAMSPSLTKVQAHVLWRETNTRLDVMAGRVREGVDVLAASEFARWLQFSGIPALLEPCESQGALPCRAGELKDKAERLIAACGEWFADHERSNFKPDPTVPRSQLESINEQLRNINATLGELSNERLAIKQSQVAG